MWVFRCSHPRLWHGFLYLQLFPSSCLLVRKQDRSREFWVSSQEVQYFIAFFFVLRVVWDNKVSYLSGIVLLVKFSKWFDVDLTVCYTSKQAVTVVSRSHCFFTYQPSILRKVISSIACSYVFWNVSWFKYLWRVFKFSMITRDCVTVKKIFVVSPFKSTTRWSSSTAT